MSEIVPFFAVPFALAKNADCAALHGELRRYFDDQISGACAALGSAAHAQREPRVYESGPDLFSVNEPCVKQLREFCLREILSVVCTLNGFDESTARSLVMQYSAWFRVVRRGGYLDLHHHPNSSWSGIYCVDPGHHDADKTGSGLLTFVNPAVAHGMFVDASNKNLVEAFSAQSRSVSLVPGQLVLFPSSVLHQVNPYEGEGTRITVSFTCSFARPHVAAAGIRSLKS
jgi:hypothetical protein